MKFQTITLMINFIKKVVVFLFMKWRTAGFPDRKPEALQVFVIHKFVFFLILLFKKTRECVKIFYTIMDIFLYDCNCDSRGIWTGKYKKCYEKGNRRFLHEVNNGWHQRQ